MPSKQQFQHSLLRIILHVAAALAIVFVWTVVATQSAQAQTFTVLHNFTGGVDGAKPSSGLTLDAVGNLYGTTFSGAGNCTSNGCGTVFELGRGGSGWFLIPLYRFTGRQDGANPAARVILGPHGSLYGTTQYGGGGCFYGCGTVFELPPPAHTSPNVFGGWTNTVLHSFTGRPDGENPWYSPVAFDSGGNIYLTTYVGGYWNYGAVVKLTPDHGIWAESVIYSFGSALPMSGVVLDGLGNLYGTNLREGLSFGVVFELTPSGSGWTENTLHSFSAGGDAFPAGGLIFDQAGNLYGTTAGDACTGGTVFMLSPSAGGWAYSLLHSFAPTCSYGGLGAGPYASLVMDTAGSLYGTASAAGAYSCGSGYGCGSVFKLTPGSDGWTFTSLHDFTGGSDGATPISSLVLDANGNMYGTASSGGTYDNGVAWQITP